MKLDIEQVRSVHWDKAYLWEAKFPDYGEWFPATDVNDEIWNVGTFDFSVGNFSALSVPAQMGPRTFVVSFLDTDKSDVLEWLDEWVNQKIFNNGQFVSPLAECVKRVTLQKQDTTRSPGKSRDYWVFPRDTMAFRGSSESTIIPHQVVFVIAGRVGK